MSCDAAFLKQCAGKIKHKSILGAEYALSINRHGKNAQVYKCNICFDYHIGTRAKNKSKNLKIKTSKGKDEYKRARRKVKRFRY